MAIPGGVMLPGGAVVGYGVVVESCDVVASADADEVLVPGVALVAAAEGTPGLPDCVAEPLFGDPFSICSS